MSRWRGFQPRPLQELCLWLASETVKVVRVSGNRTDLGYERLSFLGLTKAPLSEYPTHPRLDFRLQIEWHQVHG
ncbi:Uncharacterised protein [Vibrio cholerae]|nr:Uncharacterised protein [Vibrio cholerae]CSB85128.1 Uncharacterised protein [Vibrio cholerae]CSC97570.1 Uncharacterised protein [Vibrio cholerae]